MRVTKRRRPSCPVCGTQGALPIVYGMPGSDLMEAAEKGRAALGGCVVTGEDPEWRCRKCGYEWRSDEDRV